ncbi:MAG: exopolyphosphatase, partial [Sulfuricurvum sp.]|nr:exopolyphosphatase [Sulfuricurvum sp.]
DFESQDIIGVTTAAIRMASNQDDIIEKIFQHCGVRFRVIDGDREAQLTLLAVQNRLLQLQINPKQFVLVDIGGGSTEFIYFDDQIIKSLSLPVGIVTMSEEAKDKEHLYCLLKDFEEKSALFYCSLDVQRENIKLVLTSGTPTTIAAYRMGMDYLNYDPAKINGSILTLDDCVYTYK